MDEHARKDEEFAQRVLGEGLLTPEQVEDAKNAQAKMRELGIDKPLADVMVDKKLISVLHVHAIEKDSVVGAGHRVAGFELVRKLGQGAMGSVYLARQVTMDRLVALKVLPPRLATDSSYVDRFLREARASAKLSHANVVQGIDAGEESGLYYFAMEYVEGRTCQKIIEEKGPLPEKQAVSIARQVASALEHAHVHGLVHRDVKPDNIMLDETAGTVKLCDLGLAKSRGEAGQTGGGIAVGTPHYISPEQARGGEDVDIRADIYGLGATLYAMVTGRTPFDGPPAAVLSKHLTETCPAPRDLNHKISAGLDAVIRKMMARHRTHRYMNPKELRSDLERLEAGKNPLAMRFESESTVAPATPSRRSARREKVPPPQKSFKSLLIPGAVAITMVALAVAAYFVTGGRKPGPGKPPSRRVRRPQPPATPPRRLNAGGLPAGDLVLCNEHVEDAWITPDHADENRSAAKEAHLQSATPDRYLLRFDLSAVPKGQKIASALFVLGLKECNGEGKAFVHEILTDWTPEKVTYKNPWKKPGMVAGKDYSKEPVAGLLPVGKDRFEADLILLVEKWLSGGKNLGIVLLAERKKTLHCRFETSEAGLGKGPALVITFAEPEEEGEESPGQLALRKASEKARKLVSERKFAEALKILDGIPKELHGPVINSKLKFEKHAVVAAALAEFQKLAKSARVEEKEKRPDRAKKILKKALGWKVAAVTRGAREELRKLDARLRPKPKPEPAHPKTDAKAAARKKEEDRRKARERAAALVSQGKFAEAVELLRGQGLGGEALFRDAAFAAALLEGVRANLPRLVGAEDFKLTRKGIKFKGRIARTSGGEIVLASPQAGELSFSLDELPPDDLLAVATYRVMDPKKLLDAHLGYAVLALREGDATRARSALLKARKVAASPDTERLMKRADEMLSGAREAKAASLLADLEQAHAQRQWRTALARYRDLKSLYEETKAFKSRASAIEKMAEEARATVAPRPTAPARVEADWRKYVAGTVAAANSKLARLKKENRLRDMMEVLEGLGERQQAYELGLQALKNPRDPYLDACENGAVDLTCFRALVAMGARERADKHLEALAQKSKGKEEWIVREAEDAPKWANTYPGQLEMLADIEKKRLQFPNESSIQWEICDVLGYHLRQFLRQRGELEVMFRKFGGNAEVRNGECSWRLVERAGLFGEHVAVIRFGTPLREDHPEHYSVKSGNCSWLLAEAKQELRDYRGALELYQEVMDKHPDHWSVQYQLVPVRIQECKRALGVR